MVAKPALYMPLVAAILISSPGPGFRLQTFSTASRPNPGAGSGDDSLFAPRYLDPRADVKRHQFPMTRCMERSSPMDAGWDFLPSSCDRRGPPSWPRYAQVGHSWDLHGHRQSSSAASKDAGGDRETG